MVDDHTGYYSRPNSSTAFSIGIATLTLALLCFMLISRTTKQGVQAATTRSFPISISRATRRPTPPFSRSTATCTRNTIQDSQQNASSCRRDLDAGQRPGVNQRYGIMLRGALDKHERESQKENSSPQGEMKGLSQTTFPTSQASQSKLLQNGTLKALRPSPQSTSNRWQSDKGQRSGSSITGFTSGTKRTASGLAKVTDGSFDDRSGSSANKPITLQSGQSQLPRVSQSDFLDEDDFGSDIELDVEELEAKSTTAVKCPSLTQAPQQKQRQVAVPHAQKSGAFYPTLPKQQQTSPATYVRPADSGYGSMEPPVRSQQEPASSNPLPWSSSPAEHYTPSVRDRHTSTLDRFAYGAETQTQPSSTAERASKRRTLPWSDEENDGPTKSESRHAVASKTSRATPASVRSHFTPLPKDKKGSTYPWNTTASAVKAQQKVHKEEARKAAKTIASNEETTTAKNKKKKIPKVFLSEEQQHVLNLVVEKKKSVFFTGSAGTGKSVLLREIISSFRRKYEREPDRIAVTASTGLAACNVGGVTLHSFAGIGLGKEDIPELVRKIKKNQKAKHRWMRTKVLIVDEVSMVDGELFDKLEAIARQLRNNGRPFGGIQLVITGDFFQLPPVPESNGMGARVARFAFDAQTWKTSIEHTIALHHVFRQKDPVFAGMLNEMREGRLSDSSIKAFRTLSRPLHYKDALDATELFPTRNEVDKANQERMRSLQGDIVVYEAKDGGSVVDKTHRDKLLSNCMAPESISLKKGAQVMLIKNLDETLVNGSLGRVKAFLTVQQFEDMHAKGEGLKATQGDETGEDVDGIATGNTTIQERLLIGGAPRFPYVSFTIADGSVRELLCERETWKIELPNGEVQAVRSQVPLILAWALSIHKAQGQTLDRVKVNLGKVFENGQAYVALSRATSMSGLQVMNFDPKKVTAHQRVRNFYANLSTIELAQKLEDEKNGKPGVKKGGTGGMTGDEYHRNFINDAF